MIDRITQEKRSRVMASIHSQDTSPELKVRSLFHKMGYRFRLHRKDLPGKPDITLPKYRAIVMVHGCFWHQHTGCKDGRLPKSNKAYWKEKLKKNLCRDKKIQEQLRMLGWRVMVVWECETKNDQTLEKRLRQFIVGKCDD